MQPFFCFCFINKYCLQSNNDFCCFYSAEQDAMYELANMAINVGIWFMKHAAMIAGKDE
jgi:hypothetical protein